MFVDHTGFYDIWSRVPWNFSLWLHIFLSFRIFEQLALALTEFALKFFTVLNMFFIIQDLRNLRLPWKTECALKFFTGLNIFLHSVFLSNLRLPWKKICPEISHCIEYIFFIIQDFKQLALTLKNKVCPGIFHCIEIFCTILDFWATCACPENRFTLKFLTVLKYYLSSGFWTTCACLETQSLTWNFLLYWNILYHSGFLSNLRLLWKQSLPWNFSNQGGGHPPRLPASCAYA